VGRLAARQRPPGDGALGLGASSIDERTGRRRAVLSLDERSAAASGNTPALAHGAAADQRTIWISTRSGLVGIDARHPHHAPLQLRLPTAGRVARAGDAVWLVGGTGDNTDAAAEISYVNPADAQIDLHRTMTNVPNTNVIAGSSGAVWLAAAHELLRIKPGGSINSFLDIPHVARRVPVVAGSDGDSIAVGDGALWVASPERLPPGGARLGAVVGVDLRTSNVVASIPVPNVRGVAVAAGAVWARGADGTLREIDPRLGRVIDTVRIGGAPTLVAAHAGSVWVADASRRLLRIDAVRRRVVARLPLPGSALAIVFARGSVWVPFNR
jgi:hypothetical protein